MPRAVLEGLNVFFFVFHTCLILFNVTGWAWKRTRPWNLAMLLLTAASWFLIGLRYGTGYCVCTDLHFRVRAALGIHETADNYLQLLARSMLHVDPSAALVREVAALGFGISLFLSLALNLRDRSATIVAWASRPREV